MRASTFMLRARTSFSPSPLSPNLRSETPQPLLFHATASHPGIFFSPQKHPTDSCLVPLILTTLPRSCSGASSRSGWSKRRTMAPPFWSLLAFASKERCGVPPSPTLGDTSSQVCLQPGVCYNLQDLTERLVSHLGQWFARAGNLPLVLDVTFRPTPTNTFFAFLLDCPRWKSLRLHDCNGGFEWTWLQASLEAGKLMSEAQGGHPCWPALISLLVGTPLCTTIGQQVEFSFTLAGLHTLAPNLQALTLEVSAMNTPTAVSGFTNFSWNNLTSFTFLGMDEDHNPTFIYHILTQARNLESLSLKLPRSAVRDAPPSTVTIRPAPSLPITHEKLHHLTLGLSEDLLKTITPNIQLPSMRSLQLITPTTTERTGHPPLWFFPLLHKISYASPLFWPRLGEFAFGPADFPLTLRKGDGNFDAFKDGPAAWWAKRVGYE